MLRGPDAKPRLFQRDPRRRQRGRVDKSPELEACFCCREHLARPEGWNSPCAPLLAASIPSGPTEVQGLRSIRGAGG